MPRMRRTGFHALAALLCSSLVACQTPLERAASEGRVASVDRLLRDAPASRAELDAALLQAAERGHVDVCERLLDAGAHVDARGDGRRTPLLLAAQGGHEDVAARLVARGARIDARDEGGRTALHWAADARSPETARVLLAAGAKTDLRDEDLATALLIATDHRQAETIALLLEYGANPNVPDEDGRTPLLEAADDRRVEIARRLLEADAAPDARDRDGRSPLLYAIDNRQQELVRLLLAAGASPGQTNRDGDAALVLAVSHRDGETVELLLEAGADPDTRDASGRRAIHIARANRDTRSVELLLEHGADPKSWSAELAGQLDDPVAFAAEHGYLALARAYVENSAAIAAHAVEQAGATPGAPPAPPRTAPPSTPRRRPAPRPTSGAPALSEAELYSRRVAVVIGIDDYASWPALEGAEGDARRVAQAFRERGFDEVIELYGRDATRARIMTTLGAVLARETDPSALAVVYFAGHGETETLASGEKRGYIVPVDAQSGYVYATAIEMGTLRELSDRLPAKQVYFAMDSCYSGLGLSRGIAAIDRSRPDYVAKLASMRAVQMITAGSENEQAVERGTRGLFTTYFLRALDGEADFDGDGWVTASEIGTWVKPQVSYASENRQTPQFGSLLGTGEVVFRGRR